MTPTYQELLTGGTEWYFTDLPIRYSLAFHGHRTGEEHPNAEPHPGIWCYYLHIDEEMFPHRWNDFKPTGEGWDSYSTHSITHDMFDTEITYHRSKLYKSRKDGKIYDSRKVGCDYNHLWHHERGYPDTFQSVKADARRTVKAFLEANPDYRVCCAYSGVWGEKADFVETAKGGWVHKSKVADAPPQWFQPEVAQ